MTQKKKCIICIFHELFFKNVLKMADVYKMLEGFHSFKTTTSAVENDLKMNIVLKKICCYSVIFISPTKILALHLFVERMREGKDTFKRESLFEHFNFHSHSRFSKEPKEV